MKLTKEQLKKIREINDLVKDLDPIMKERIIDYELSDLLKQDYVSLLESFKNVKSHKENSIQEIAGKEKPSLDSTKVETSNIRDFYLNKRPSSLTETVAVFGFFLEHNRNFKDFGKKEISEAFFEARVRKPKVIGQALRDAKNKKSYLVDGVTKGKYRISNEGENLVLHDLPRKVNIKP